MGEPSSYGAPTDREVNDPAKLNKTLNTPQP